MIKIENLQSQYYSDCENVIMPRIADKIKGKEREFCPRCQCKFENRNTSIIKFVVILVIWVISLLVVYMLFLICLDPLLNKRVKANYQEHTNEEVKIFNVTSLISNISSQFLSIKQDDVTLSGVPGPSVHPMGVRSNVLNRVGHQQDKWKRQVREQRKNIYDRHTMLNQMWQRLRSERVLCEKALCNKRNYLNKNGDSHS